VINPEEILIATIKDLKGVFFYYVGDSTDKRISGLSIVYGDNKKLDYDYTYKYYKEYVMQVLSVYKREKKNNKIILYNELTEQVMNSYDISKIQIDKDDHDFSETRIRLLSINNFNIKDIEEYLKKIILSIMEVEIGNNDTVIKSITGCMNKYLVEYVTSDGKVGNVVFQCIKKNSDMYDFKMYFSDIKFIRSIDGCMEITDDYFYVSWDNYDRTLRGEYYYNPVENICREYIIDEFDKVLYFGDAREVLLDDKKNSLLSLADSVGIKCNSIIPMVTDSYILYDEKKRTMGDNTFYKRKVGYTTFKKEYTSVIYLYTEGVLKYDGTFVVPFMKEQKEIRYIPFDIDDEHYLLKEIVNVPTDKMSGEYQKKMNKYGYYILKVSQNNDLRMPFDILIEERIKNNEIDNLTEVKEYVRTRKKGL